MGVTIKAGQAYITATPSSQDSQVLRVRASSDYTAYTINANSSGSTKYDWIYLKVDATKANNPASDASDVTSVYTSRSSSNTTDNGTPPTYGLLLAVVTVANGASSITNSNITDKRFNTSIGAQNGSLIVTQQATGDDAIIQAAGTDANISLRLIPKGTGSIKRGTTGGAIDWWEELGRTTNSGSGSISVSSFTAKKYLRVIAYWHPSGANSVGVTFNSDTGNNYARRDSTNGAADGSAGSLANVCQTNTSGTPTSLMLDILNNNAADEKLVFGWSLEQNTAGATNVPNRREHVGKWANTSAQITTITLTISAGNMGAAELVVLGHD